MGRITRFIGEVLAGEAVGVAETHAGDWFVRHADIDLGIHDNRPVSSAASARPGLQAPTENP
ncbi:MAG: hypothetical protein ACTSXZ_03145 [Alphaproteobacteria bacterium]